MSLWSNTHVLTLMIYTAQNSVCLMLYLKYTCVLKNRLIIQIRKNNTEQKEDPRPVCWSIYLKHVIAYIVCNLNH